MDPTVHRAAALLLLALLAACRIDRTPQELIDPMNPAVVDNRESEREVAARVGLFRESLSRGSRSDAVAALLPLPDAHVIGADGHRGRPRFGEAGVLAALEAVEIPDGGVVRMPDLRVQTDLRDRMAWFATHLELLPAGAGGGAPERLRMSGVLRRLEGEWRLVQLHLSRAAADLTPAPPPPVPRGGAAPPGDG
jgi:hypothetical protein